MQQILVLVIFKITKRGHLPTPVTEMQSLYIYRLYIYGGFLKWGTPKSFILVGFSIINHHFWGTHILGNLHYVYIYTY